MLRHNRPPIRRAWAAWMALPALLVSCGTSSPASPEAIRGKWAAVEGFSEGESHEFAPRGRLEIEFDTDGLYSGTAPCNRIMGMYTFDGKTLETENNAISAVLCGEAIMALEELTLRTLRAAPVQVTFTNHDGVETMEWRADGTRMTLVRP